MITFKCKMCGGDLSFEQGATVCECPYCGTTQTLPRLDDDKRANLYDRANHFRRQNEYDKAMAIYEQILAEDRTDAEAYWSLVLCRYGIEYVEDPTSHKRVPTVNRVQYASILADEDYKAALQYADTYQRSIYEAEANAIAEIQKGILDISKKEDPFDVFICYKETDANGRRTPDSVLANDMYHQLTKEGFKVFFSRITLEDKIGTAYEPYIFAALNSAKVMVVLGTKPEYFNAVWLKNEWSRYLALIRAGADKTLVPAYRDMDPYNLPDEFAHLQAQDMGKLGFMQDLIRGIKKIAVKDESMSLAAQTAAPVAGNVAPLLKRAFIFLEDGDFVRADDFCEQVLNLDPENARAYLGKLMAELKVRLVEELMDQSQLLDSNNLYQKIIRFGDETLRTQIQKYNVYIKQKNEHEKQRTGNLKEMIIALREEYETRKQEYESAKLQEKRADDALRKTISELKDANDSLSKYQLELQNLRGLFIKRHKQELEKSISYCKERIANAEAQQAEAEIRYQEAKKRLPSMSDIMEITYKIAANYVALEDYESAYKEYKKIKGYKNVDDILMTNEIFAAIARARIEPIKAPMPGKINAIRVSEGQNVKKGDVILILEAMKMENEIVSPRDGVVDTINVSKGDTVKTGDILFMLR